jgi:hypothetical protein
MHREADTFVVLFSVSLILLFPVESYEKVIALWSGPTFDLPTCVFGEPGILLFAQ